MIDSTRIPCAFILTLRRPLRSTLFPYTTLFRSRIARAAFMRYVFTALIALSLCLSPFLGATPAGQTQGGSMKIDRKSTRLNSSHVEISYAVFCLKKKNNLRRDRRPRTHGSFAQH